MTTLLRHANIKDGLILEILNNNQLNIVLY
jgi:hypothetical protein